MSDSQEYIASVLTKNSWEFFSYAAIFVLFSAMVTDCAATPPILTIVHHGSAFDYDPDFEHGPDFKIMLFEDGKVHYHGIEDVNLIGDGDGRITPEQVQKMVVLYKKIYENQQRFFNIFYTKYNKRFSVDPIERSRLEEFKRQYIDWREWNSYMLFNSRIDSSRSGPLGSRSSSILGILNQMINLEPWVCYPKPDPRHKACPVLKASPNYQEYLKYLESEK